MRKTEFSETYFKLSLTAGMMEHWETGIWENVAVVQKNCGNRDTGQWLCKNVKGIGDGMEVYGSVGDQA